MIAIIDYGVGNLFSLQSSLKALGEEVVVSSKEKDIKNASKIILPGVGAFSDAMIKLKECHGDELLRQAVSYGKPVLGICLGMQLLFETSMEYGKHSGLGLISGDIIPLSEVIPPELKIPHMGWNGLNFPKESKKNQLFKYINENDCVYFVHSYFASCCFHDVIATADYGIPITAAASKDNLYGCQFHPEKSGTVGLNILKAFCEL